MDIVFQASVICGHKIKEDEHGHATKICGRESDWIDRPDEGETSAGFEERARAKFQKRGWSIEGKKIRCPDHN